MDKFKIFGAKQEQPIAEDENDDQDDDGDDNEDDDNDEDDAPDEKESECNTKTTESVQNEAEIEASLKMNIIEKPPVWPFAITSPYGKLRKLQHSTKAKVHTGIDFVGWNGKSYIVDTVKSGVYGKVLFARLEKSDQRGTNWGGRGNTVTVQCTKNPKLYSNYLHLASIAVKEGQLVTPDTVIGMMGNTGHSLGAHLHYEIKEASADKVQMSNGIPIPSHHVDPNIYYLGDFNRQSKIMDAKKMKILHKGEADADVEFLQSLLTMRGYKVIIDGHFGQTTEDVVKDFQTDAKLTADGIVGPGTWAQLV